jgi:hypothetical protein
MSQQWRIRIGDKVSKPLSADEVQKYHKAGKIPPDAMFSQDGQNWRTMKDTGTLLGNTRNTPMEEVQSEEEDVSNCSLCGDRRPTPVAACPTCGSLPSNLADAGPKTPENVARIGVECFKRADSGHQSGCFVSYVPAIEIAKAKQTFARTLNELEKPIVLIELVVKD